MSQADIGLVGLAVMGQNLVLNFCDHGYQVAVYNRTPSRVDEFVSGAEQSAVQSVHTQSVMQLFEQTAITVVLSFA